MANSVPRLLALRGHDNAQALLQQQLIGPASAILFSGPKGVGKTFAAVQLAWNLLQAQNNLDYRSHWDNLWQKSEPNFLWIQKPEEATRIGIGQIHNMQQQVAMGPRLGSRYLFVLIEEATLLTTEAANALLKTLEEPPRGVCFLLISSQPHKLLPTIRSRCLPIWFGFLSGAAVAQIIQQNDWVLEDAFSHILKSSGQLVWLTPELSWQSDLAIFFDNCANLAQLSIHDALDWAADLSESKEKAHYFLEALLYWLRQNQNHEKINLVLDTLKRFSYNINLKLQLEHLMLGLVS